MERSLPVSLENEGSPVGGIAETVLAREGEAGLAERRGGPQAFRPHSAVELRHESGRRPVVDPPEARDHPRRSGVEEAAGEPEESFAADLLTQGRLAAGEHHEVGRQVEVVDVAQAEEPFAGMAGRVDAREGEARELRPLRVEDAVGGEVDVAEVPQASREDEVAVGREVEPGGDRVRRGQGGDRLRFLPREAEPAQARESLRGHGRSLDRKSTRLNSSHANISYAVFCLKKKKKT